jgi:hypothetical protein
MPASDGFAFLSMPPTNIAISLLTRLPSVKKDRQRDFLINFPVVTTPHSHSIVPGGFEVTS